MFLFSQKWQNCPVMNIQCNQLYSSIIKLKVVEKVQWNLSRTQFNRLKFLQYVQYFYSTVSCNFCFIGLTKQIKPFSVYNQSTAYTPGWESLSQKKNLIFYGNVWRVNIDPLKTAYYYYTPWCVRAVEDTWFQEGGLQRLPLSSCYLVSKPIIACWVGLTQEVMGSPLSN